MEEVGKFLCSVREEHNLSIEAIAEKTNIKPGYLIAIEVGDRSELPAEVYIRGFLRSYARALGLTPDEIMAMYDRQSQANALESQPKLSRLEQRRAARRKQRIWFGVILGIVLAGLVIYYVCLNK